MQRAMKGIADRVLPLVDREALGQWALCAMDALGQRDTEALQRNLPPLLRACDQRVLGRLVQVPREEEAPKVHRAEERVLGSPSPAVQEDEALEPSPHVEERGFACLAPAAEKREAPEGHPSGEERVHSRPAPAPQEDEALDAPSSMEECRVGWLAPATEERLPGAVFANLSNSRTGFRASPPEAGPQPEPPSAASCEPTHGERSRHPLPSVPEGFTPGLPSLRTPQDSQQVREERPAFHPLG
jgi:hypothetical protein